ncbi:MAG: 30S ribosomal protein S14 [Puniceicoccales bacterium]|jgi:small subunit ribosomal protein S14|nr:30S ribosomal protein S14 [Puniceicoccales bacterium]
MAKTSSVERNKKRMHLVEKHGERRRALKSKLLNLEVSDDAFFKTQRELALLPRNSSPVRVRNRCSITGRARGYFGKFGVSRLTLREFALKGLLPGVTKASW